MPAETSPSTLFLSEGFSRGARKALLPGHLSFKSPAPKPRPLRKATGPPHEARALWPDLGPRAGKARGVGAEWPRGPEAEGGLRATPAAAALRSASPRKVSAPGCRGARRGLAGSAARAGLGNAVLGPWLPPVHPCRACSPSDVQPRHLGARTCTSACVPTPLRGGRGRRCRP